MTHDRAAKEGEGREPQPYLREPVGGPFHKVLNEQRDIVWIVTQNDHVHSVHATHESAMAERGEDLRIGAPWQIQGAATQPPQELVSLRELIDKWRSTGQLAAALPKFEYVSTVATGETLIACADELEAALTRGEVEG